MLVVHNETATGVTSDIAAVRKAIDNANHPALLYVDGVSSVGSLEFRMDDWGVDLAITGSQKGFMLPAGLGIIGVSQKALAQRESAKLPRVLLRLRRHDQGERDGLFPVHAGAHRCSTACANRSTCCSRRGSTTCMRVTTVSPRACARRSRRGGSSSARRSPKWNSDTVSAIMTPRRRRRRAGDRDRVRSYNLALGAGLGQMAGKLFRIGHLGDLNELMLLGAIAGAEMAMRDVGMTQIVPGSGVGCGARSIGAAGGADAVPRAGAPKSAEKRARRP